MQALDLNIKAIKIIFSNRKTHRSIKIYLKVKSKLEGLGLFYHHIGSWQEVFHGQTHLENSHIPYLHLGGL